MMNLRYSALAIATLAVLYQWWLKDVLFVTLGIGRVVQPIEEFPYKCRRLENKQLEGCGDMWLDEDHCVLYAACTGEAARDSWNPSLLKFNYTGRRRQGSQMMAIYIDEPLKNGLFKMHPILPTDYGSAPGDGKLDLIGFDVEVQEDESTRRFWLLNQRPPYDANGTLLDPKKHGANITIDLYEHRKGDKKMNFIAKGWSPTLHAANKIVFVGSNNFVVSNDRSPHGRLRRSLDPLLGGGSLVFHDDWYDSYRTTPKKLPILGAMVRGLDDRIYVPSIVDDKIRVFELQAHGLFKQVHAIRMGMPIVGLTVDSTGDMWAVGRSKYDPTGRSSTNALFKIGANLAKYEEQKFQYPRHKVLEDGERKFLKGASVARYDVKTKRIFFGGSHMPFISVCEQQ